MTTADLHIKQGDTLPDLVATLTDEHGGAIDLTNATSVTFIMRQEGRNAVVSHTATITTPAQGKVTYAWQDGDTDIAGIFQAVFEILFSGGAILTVPTDGFITIEITDDISAISEVVTPVTTPDTTLVTYGTGIFRWTPTVTHDGAPVSGATVRVVSSTGVLMGPATTGVTGECLASDSKGAFRINAGIYTVTIVSGSVTASYTLTMDSSGNGVMA
jgi:hypothetical protein